MKKLFLALIICILGFIPYYIVNSQTRKVNNLKRNKEIIDSLKEEIEVRDYQIFKYDAIIDMLRYTCDSDRVDMTSRQINSMFKYDFWRKYYKD